jgi:hypothetical protein
MDRRAVLELARIYVSTSFAKMHAWLTARATRVPPLKHALSFTGLDATSALVNLGAFTQLYPVDASLVLQLYHELWHPPSLTHSQGYMMW